jgi:hypothetical protein
MTSRSIKKLTCALFAFIFLFADMGVVFAQQGPPPQRPVRRGRNPSPGVPRRRPFVGVRVVQPSLTDSAINEAFIASLAAERADRSNVRGASPATVEGTVVRRSTAKAQEENFLYSFVYSLLR